MKLHESPLRIAIVGSGPSGFFCADYLLRLARPCTVALFERQPYPFGLVRDAVAPDKPNIRAAMAALSKTAQMNGFSFFGNVQVGRDLSVEELLHRYHAVIVASGAQQARPLEIQGDNFTGNLDALSLAGWYNGRPDCSAVAPVLDAASAVIIGAGNAAMDVARILASPAGLLASTDIAGAALAALAVSKITDIHIVARRGPLSVRFAPQELELLAELPECSIKVHAELSELDNAESEPAQMRLRKAYHKACKGAAGSRCIHFHFNCIPLAILGEERVSGVLFEEHGGEHIHIPCGLVISSIGQQGVRMPGIPFDEETGSIPHVSGRVREGGHFMQGMYVAGAAKRGFNSTIGANKPECLETVKSIIEDRGTLTCQSEQDDHALLAHLKAQGVPVVTFQDWLVLDELERHRGALKGKPRERFCSTDAMLRALAEMREPDADVQRS